MAKINPISLKGRWKLGFALDKHVLSSVHVGMDEHGHDRFESTRSEVGELVYKLKYRGQQEAVTELITTSLGFLQTQGAKPDIVIPVPPTKKRQTQPVSVLAQGIAGGLGVNFSDAAVTKVKDVPAVKDVAGVTERMEMLKGCYAVSKDLVIGKTVLLVDDLYQTGATMNAVASALYDMGAKDVFVLTMTKTRSYS